MILKSSLKKNSLGLSPKMLANIFIKKKIFLAKSPLNLILFCQYTCKLLLWIKESSRFTTNTRTVESTEKNF